MLVVMATGFHVKDNLLHLQQYVLYCSLLYSFHQSLHKAAKESGNFKTNLQNRSIPRVFWKQTQSVLDLGVVWSMDFKQTLTAFLLLQQLGPLSAWNVSTAAAENVTEAGTGAARDSR